MHHGQNCTRALTIQAIPNLYTHFSFNFLSPYVPLLLLPISMRFLQSAHPWKRFTAGQLESQNRRYSRDVESDRKQNSLCSRISSISHYKHYQNFPYPCLHASRDHIVCRSLSHISFSSNRADKQRSIRQFWNLLGLP
jgi:hypothetical protein